MLSTQAQLIDSIIVVPHNPTIEDSITILCYARYGNSSCELINKWLETNSITRFSGNAIHCMQSATDLCPVIDTFMLTPIETGSYTFIYNPGYDSLCIVPMLDDTTLVPFPWRQDSIEFSVGEISSIYKLSNEKSVAIFPNPVENLLTVSFFDRPPLNFTFTLFNPNGKVCFRKNLDQAINEFELITFPVGVYFYEIKEQYQTLQSGKLLIIR